MGGDDTDLAPGRVGIITDADLQARVQAALHIVAFYPNRDGITRIVVEIYEKEPPLDLAPWDHVAEASLDVSSGEIFICGVVSDLGAVNVWVIPGCYRLRLHFGNLGSALDSRQTYGDDRYLVAFWPSPTAGATTVLKQYEYQPPEAAEPS